MSLEIHFFNTWAVLAGIVTNMIIGALWYSPVLFGNYWLKLTGLKMEDINQNDANKSMMLSIFPAAITIILLAIVLGVIDAVTLLDAIIVGSLLSVGFIGMSTLNLVLFENRSMKLAILNTGYSFTAFNIAAVVLVLWK